MKYKKKSFFITIEGIDGSGKTTVLNIIHKILKKYNISHTLTREPGGTEISEKIRNLLLESSLTKEKLHPNTELLLIFAGRAQHIEQVIKPSMKLKKWVVCDRFTDSTYAYQGGGRKIILNKISELELWIQQDIKPDITFLLDISINSVKKRKKNRNFLDRIESENANFFESVRKMYLNRAKKYSERFIIINAELPLNIIKKNIEKEIIELIKLYER